MLEGFCQNIEQIDLLWAIQTQGLLYHSISGLFQVFKYWFKVKHYFNNKSKLKFVAFDGLILLLN